MTDSEYNLDPNCLSRCSTELFSEASWEQVDKQDTEVSGQLNPSVSIREGRQRGSGGSGGSVFMFIYGPQDGADVWRGAASSHCSVRCRSLAGTQTIWLPSVTAARAGSGSPPGSTTAGKH